jgi:O-antigen ligase
MPSIGLYLFRKMQQRIVWLRAKHRLPDPGGSGRIHAAFAERADALAAVRQGPVATGKIASVGPVTLGSRSSRSDSPPAHWESGRVRSLRLTSSDARGAARADRWRLLAAELFSIETSFVLFLFSGWYKNLGYLRSFPVDLTLAFAVLTIGLIGGALVAGRLKPPPPTRYDLLMILFSALAVAGLAWSSFDSINIDKALRFLFLTSPGFFVADIIARQAERRSRFVRLLILFCCAFLLYYAYSRYLLGIEMQAGGPTGADNYLEYGSAAGYLFVTCLALAALGSPKRFLGAALGMGVALYGLLIMGGRAPLTVALLAIPLLALGLLRHGGRSLRRLALLAGLVAVAAVAYLGLGPADRTNGEAAAGFRTLQRYEMQLSGQDTRSMDQRLAGRELAVRMWLEKPVFGWGIGEFKIADSYLKYPHNTLFEILAEMGLAGLFLFLCVCIPAVRDCARIVGDRARGWTDVAIALLFLTELAAHLTVQGYLADDRAFFAYMGLVIGSCTVAARGNRRALRLRIASRGSRPRAPRSA